MRTVESRLLCYLHDVLLRVSEQIAGVFYAVSVDVIVERTLSLLVEEGADVRAVGAYLGSDVRHLEVGVEEDAVVVE